MYVGFGVQGCGQADKLMVTTESGKGVGMFDAACCPLDANEGTRFRLSVVEKSKWNWNPAEVEFYSDVECSTRIPNSKIESLQSNPPDVLTESNGASYPLSNLIDGSTSSFWYGTPDCRSNCDDSWVEFTFSETVAIGCYKLYQRQIRQDDRFASAVVLSVYQDGQLNDFCPASGLTSGNWAQIHCGQSSANAVHECARGSLEVHEEENHGDVCRTAEAANGNWECPTNCEMTPNGNAPYCLIIGTQDECTGTSAVSDLTLLESVVNNDFLLNGLAVVGVVSVAVYGYSLFKRLGKQDYETIHDDQEI